MSVRRRILLIDDHADDRTLAASMIARSPAELTACEVCDAADFAAEIARGEFAAVVTEHQLPWSDGLRILAAVKDLYPERPVVLFTAADPVQLLDPALRLGLDGYLSKSSTGYLRLPDLLIEVLDRAARRPAGDESSQRLIEELSRRTEELKRSNAELELFAHVVSHDLQEPLQLVTRYGRLLGQRYGDQLGDEGKGFLEHLTSSTERMQAMIDDIFEYSRVGSQQRPFREVDLETVLDDVIDNLETAIEESEAVITRDSLPRLSADRAQMAQLFQNLLANALKFRREAPPEIHVGARAEGGNWVLSVRDNGIGIDPQHHERIFKMFQRLHSASEFPGTGVGLAICQRIVQHHGGEIRLTSEPEAGSTFEIILPRRGEESS